MCAAAIKARPVEGACMRHVSSLTGASGLEGHGQLWQALQGMVALPWGGRRKLPCLPCLRMHGGHAASQAAGSVGGTRHCRTAGVNVGPVMGPTSLLPPPMPARATPPSHQRRPPAPPRLVDGQCVRAAREAARPQAGSQQRPAPHHPVGSLAQKTLARANTRRAARPRPRGPPPVHQRSAARFSRSEAPTAPTFR